MLKFKLADKPTHVYLKPSQRFTVWEILEISNNLGIAFYFNRNIAGDIVEFLNDKYFDKEINKEWPAIDVEERIKYHQEQIKLLKERKHLRWNEHGTGVE